MKKQTRIEVLRIKCSVPMNVFVSDLGLAKSRKFSVCCVRVCVGVSISLSLCRSLPVFTSWQKGVDSHTCNHCRNVKRPLSKKFLFLLQRPRFHVKFSESVPGFVIAARPRRVPSSRQLKIDDA